jgi:hypothetical protein
MKHLKHQMALRDLQATFFWKIDRRDTADIATLFTEDGQLVVPDLATRMTTILTIKGREALTQQWAHRPPDLVTRHVFTNLQIRLICATEATSRCISIGFRHTGPGVGPPHTEAGVAPPDIAPTFGLPQPVIVADHDDRYQLGPDRRWRFLEKRITPVFVSPTLLNSAPTLPPRTGTQH